MEYWSNGLRSIARSRATRAASMPGAGDSSRASASPRSRPCILSESRPPSSRSAHVTPRRNSFFAWLRLRRPRFLIATTRARPFTRLIRLAHRCIVVRRRNLAGLAASRTGRNLLSPMIRMRSARSPSRREKSLERFVENRAIRLVLDQCRRQPLPHPLPLEPDYRNRIDRINRFRNRNPDAAIAQRRDESQQSDRAARPLFSARR